ncbi:MAG TPA: hypothetical protein PLO20_08525 [Thermogutta sp.]|nr:hypothetical protein [Thermogutta sp.]HQF13742.1 hypothetical protein [Thermogutta sp.]
MANSSKTLSIPIDLGTWGTPVDLPNVGVPLRFGVPLPRGKLSYPCRGQLVSPSGAVFPTQIAPVASWPDGSARWVRIDTVIHACLTSQWRETWQLDFESLDEPTGQGIPDRIPLRLGYSVVPTSSRDTVFAFVDRASNEPLAVAHVFMKTKAGSVRLGQCRHLRWHVQGPICYEATAEGTFPGVRGLLWRVTLRVYPTLNAIHIKAMLRNTRRARHRGGLWDLGDPGSILLREFGLRLEWRDPLKHLVWRAKPSEVFHIVDGDRWPGKNSTGSRDGDSLIWQVHQASSGGDHWNSFNHVNARGQVTLPFRGYRAISPEGTTSGDRADPLACLQTAAYSCGFWMPDFWQEFPKRIDVGPRSSTLAFLAENPEDVHELQGGEQKTYVAWIVLSDGSDDGRHAVTTQLMALCRRVTVRSALQQALVELPSDLPPPELWPGTALAQFAEEAGFGPKGLLAGREEIDEYGWRHFGDVYASHEKAFYEGRLPFVSHYNNQFDLLCGLILCRLVSNDPRWEELIHPLARHVIDIDIYHTLRDRSTFNGGMFWMTDHYVTAATATHRAFSRENAQRPGYGGGPSNEQNYTSGLTLYYLLWGDEDARDAVLSLANWVISMEDGRQTPFFIADDGPTGLATATSSPDYHGPGRGSANSVNALLDAWLISGNAVYRSWAEKLCRRVIHPKDDPAAFGLLHAETRWSYTMFLEVLCKFLRIKCLFGEHDHTFEYLRRSLICYCDWMVHHERPYLDHPEELEYPTEAWAAQEFRKATVLFLAAKFAEPERAARYRQKAIWFAEKAWEELNRFESRINPRTAAVILNQAIWHLADAVSEGCACCLRLKDESLSLPPREIFIPQRARVRRMLTSRRDWPRIAVRLANPYNWFRLIQILWQWRN